MCPYTHATRLDTPVDVRMCVWRVCSGAGIWVHLCVHVYGCCVRVRAHQYMHAYSTYCVYVDTRCVRVGEQHILTRKSVCRVRLGAHPCMRTSICVLRMDLTYRFANKVLHPSYIIDLLFDSGETALRFDSQGLIYSKRID